MLHLWRRAFGALITIVIGLHLMFDLADPAKAAVLVQGRVVDRQSVPVPGVDVTMSGGNRTLQARTDGKGRFVFAAVDPGEYDVEAADERGGAKVHILVATTDVDLALVLSPVKTLGRIVTASSSVVTRSGGSAIVTARELSHLPSSNTVANVLAQLPSSVRASNGQIHINGEHGAINYYIDGMPLPQSLNRVFGAEIDPADVAFMDVIEGAFPAEYGNRFAAIVNIATVAGTGKPGGEARLAAGSFGQSEFSLTGYDRLGPANISVALRQARVGWALDPPVPNANHDAGSVSNEFLRFTLPAGRSNSVNVDVAHSLQTFQIPPDTAHGVPASTDDVEIQNDAFIAVQWNHAIGDKGFLLLGSSLKISRIADLPDVANDLAAGAGDDCLTNPADCVFAAADNRLARDLAFNAAYGLRAGHHDLRAGASYSVDTVRKHYAITVQPNNSVSGPLPFTIIDDSPNAGHQMSFYVQDGWMLSPRWRLDAGLRTDVFSLRSDSFEVAFSQTSPRIKLTRVFNERSSIYAYYGRLFEPFSFENISAGNAQFLNPGSSASFDLKPQRDSLYEIGGQFPAGRAQGSWKISHKTIADVIDDAQVGATNIHQDINFDRGVTDVQTILLQWPRRDGNRTYASFTHSRAVVKGCGSALLVDCSQFPSDFVNADHDQRWTATAGEVIELGAGWVGLDAEYGSGLSSTQCDACKVPPHVTFDAEIGKQLRGNGTLVLAVRNVLNDRYAITIDSSLQGTHYAEPRSVELSYRLKY